MKKMALRGLVFLVVASIFYAGELTSREKEVADLALIGFSSKQISAKLHISVRPVDTHLGNIFEKTWN